MEFSIQDFDISEADWSSQQEILSEIRRIVFILEQNVPEEEEWDDRDDTAHHWLASLLDGTPIGTARLLTDGQIGRMAVLEEHRGKGVGGAMLSQAVSRARDLGFESVFLHAQSHAVSFYEKAGFHVVGEEFMEAGIAHRMMEQQLTLTDAIEAFGNVTGNNVIAENLEPIVLQDFDVVLKEENQQVSRWVATSTDGEEIASITMNHDGHITSLEVNSAHRLKGIGRSLLDAACMKAVRLNLTQITIQGNQDAETFLNRCAFIQSADNNGLNNNLSDNPEGLHYFVRDIPRDELHPDATVLKNVSKGEIHFIKTEEEAREAILQICNGARNSVRIHSPLLDHNLYHNQRLYESLSALARRNRYTHIDILIYDSHRIIKNTHLLLELSRKLSSSIKIKLVHPDYQQSYHDYVIADNNGIVFRQDHNNYDGFFNRNDPSMADRYSREFTRAWETGLEDPNIRALKI